MTERRKVKLSRSLVVPIVGDAAMAGPVADGRLIPILVLDATARPEVAEVLRVHKHLPPGDALSQWGLSRDNDDEVFLHLTFVQPMDVVVILLFDVRRQAILVDAMLSAGGVYLQAGTPDDSPATRMNAHKVLAELPDTGFQPHWDQFLLDRMTDLVAKRLGTSRRKARPAATEFIAEMRKMSRFRIGGVGQSKS